MPLRSREVWPGLLLLVGVSALLAACGTRGPPTPARPTEVVSYTFTPSSPATLKFGEEVIAALTYTSGHATPIRMWARIEYDGPITEGTLDYCPSPAIADEEGTVERCFSVVGAFIEGVPSPIHIDTIEVSITDQDQTVELYRELLAVDYTWEP